MSNPTIAQISAHHGAPKYAPEDGKKMLIMGQDLGSVGGLTGYEDGYIDHLGNYPAGVTTYTSLPSLSGLKSKTNWGAGDVHADAYTEDQNFDNAFIAVGLHIVGQLSAINGGYIDDKIEILGSWIKDQDRPVYLRIGYEFDGSWNNYDPESFKTAWKRIVLIFDRLEVLNVVYVWQSAGINTPNIERWYPGDEFVNWVGYSHFDGGNPGQSIRDFAEEHDKPIMIAEATPRRDLSVGSGAEHWSAWYNSLFASIYKNDRIKALAYINADWDNQPMWKGQGWGDSRVQINEEVLMNWRNEMNRSEWVFANETLFEDLGHEEWLNTIILDSEISRSVDQMLVDKNDNILTIRLSNNSTLNGLFIWDLSGQLIEANGSEMSQYEFIIDSNIKQKILMVSIVSNGKMFSKKIWIK